MKLGVVGSRDWTDYEQVKEYLDLICSHNHVTAIVSGGARGVDKMAERYSREELGMEPTVFLPDVKRWGIPKALFKRNTEIVKHSDIVIALWDGKSTGTADTIRKAKNFERQHFVVYARDKAQEDDDLSGLFE